MHRQMRLKPYPKETMLGNHLWVEQHGSRSLSMASSSLSVARSIVPGAPRARARISRCSRRALVGCLCQKREWGIQTGESLAGAGVRVFQGYTPSQSVLANLLQSEHVSQAALPLSGRQSTSTDVPTDSKTGDNHDQIGHMLERLGTHAGRHSLRIWRIWLGLMLLLR
jgi:hypothetical protein